MQGSTGAGSAEVIDDGAPMRFWRLNRSCDFSPECCRNESGKMPHVRGCDDQTRPVQGCGLPGQNDIAIEGSVRCGRTASLAGRGPNFCRATHRGVVMAKYST